MQFHVYIGTYTGPGKAQGIYRANFDSVSGKLSTPALAIEAEQPSFLAIHPTRRLLYAVGETNDFKNQPGGSISAFSIEPRTGTLMLHNQTSSIGAGPCHLSLDKDGKHVAVGNYVGGSVAVLALEPDGHLGKATAFIQHTGSSVNSARQQEPHVHSVNFSPDARFLFAADLGTDKLMVYPFDQAVGGLIESELSFITMAPGAGARHFTFHPTGRFAYLLNELDGTIVVYHYTAATGGLAEIQTIDTLPSDFTGINYTSEILVHPTGKFLYNSNRGHDSIAVFQVDQQSGRLALLEIKPTGGKWPRNFAIDPTGQWLLVANEYSNNIIIFYIEPDRGRLIPTSDVLPVPAPACLKFVGG